MAAPAVSPSSSSFYVVMSGGTQGLPVLLGGKRCMRAASLDATVAAVLVQRSLDRCTVQSFVLEKGAW
eukprot:1386537-Alexandrium_andersonii.AAC.1